VTDTYRPPSTVTAVRAAEPPTPTPCVPHFRPCNRMYAPVCAPNGRTYANTCTALADCAVEADLVPGRCPDLASSPPPSTAVVSPSPPPPPAVVVTDTISPPSPKRTALSPPPSATTVATSMIITPEMSPVQYLMISDKMNQMIAALSASREADRQWWLLTFLAAGVALTIALALVARRACYLDEAQKPLTDGTTSSSAGVDLDVVVKKDAPPTTETSSIA